MKKIVIKDDNLDAEIPKFRVKSEVKAKFYAMCVKANTNMRDAFRAFMEAVINGEYELKKDKK